VVIKSNSILKHRARYLRKTITEAEKRLWYFLRDRRLDGYKFSRQCVLEPYIVDFICREKQLILEIDGGQHANNFLYDEKRTLFLQMQGFQLLRFWNNDVLKNTEGVLESILKILTQE